ncbi:MAG: hypothetical protein QM763_02350 [Agriterribacter sp.]
MQKKGLGLLIAAVAAYSIYRISKMSPEEKTALKEKGKKFLKENFEWGNLPFIKTAEQVL